MDWHYHTWNVQFNVGEDKADFSYLQSWKEENCKDEPITQFRSYTHFVMICKDQKVAIFQVQLQRLIKLEQVFDIQNAGSPNQVVRIEPYLTDFMTHDSVTDNWSLFTHDDKKETYEQSFVDFIKPDWHNIQSYENTYLTYTSEDGTDVYF